MADAPSYLGMLNSIFMAEQRGYEYLSAWADVTPDPDVRAVLRTVALREGEHARAFAKRINELGFEAHDDGPSNEFRRKLGIVTSDAADLEKMHTLGYDFDNAPDADAPDAFDTIFRDKTIDVDTGKLLGRYIAEERDTARRFRSCYAILSAREQRGTASADRLAGLDAKVDAVCRGVEELRQIVCAQSMPAGTA